MAWIRIIGQRESRPRDQSNNTEEVHGEPRMVNFSRMIPT